MYEIPARSPEQVIKFSSQNEPKKEVIPQGLNDYQAILYQQNRPSVLYSLEQTRFQNRIKNASRRQNDLYKHQIGQHKTNEKEKYAKMLEQRELQSIGAQGDDVSWLYNNKRTPLGKIVTQVEMNNEEARSQLKEMLEYQIREKEQIRQEEADVRNLNQIKRMEKEQEQINHEKIMQNQIEL